MSPDCASWKCRCCGFDRWHNVTVKRRNGALYETSFYACSGCSVMFLNPNQFNVHSTSAPNVELPKVVRIRAAKS
jgi:hypothetical protein